MLKLPLANKKTLSSLRNINSAQGLQLIAPELSYEHSFYIASFPFLFSLQQITGQPELGSRIFMSSI